MADSWVKTALESALLVVDNAVLVRAAGMHVQPEFETRGRVIRPSSLASDCQLQTVKRFRGHGPQPHVDWMAARQGRPDSNSNLVFARGFLGEGLVVAALKEYSRMTGEFEVLGCAPELMFEAEPDYEAHPDLMVLRHGQIETIQIKTPSVFAFDRYDRGDQASVMERYRPQVVGEMVIGRKMGIEIEVGNLLLFTWEGYGPGRNESGIRCLSIPLEWQDSMTGYVETIAEEIRELDRQAALGNWPRPAKDRSDFNKWPCSYCSYARTARHPNQVECTEVEKWEKKQTEEERLIQLAATVGSSSTS